MSIILIDKKLSMSTDLKINSEFLNTPIVKKLASHQLNCLPNELRLFHLETDKQYGEHQIVRQGDKIEYLIINKNDNSLIIENRKKGIIYPDQLEKIIQNSKIIVIKSANQQNIQKSKTHSLWATTFSNQERLKYFFNNNPNVLFIFATNRSYEIKGLARMQSQPDKITDKSIWSGVSNIRLGGNFKIKWLRKKPLSLVTVQKNLGTNFKESIIKSCDGQQLDPIFCKKLSCLFEVPDEPYYHFNDKNNQINKKSPGKHQIIGQILLPTSNFHEIKFPPVPLIVSPPVNASSLQKKQRRESRSSNENSSSQELQKKSKKIKKDKRKKKHHKKEKKSHKKYSNRSSSSESNGSYSSDHSSSYKDIKKKSKKDKRHKKHKKHKK